MAKKKNQKPYVQRTPKDPTHQSVGIGLEKPYTYSDISAHFWINGTPPESEEFRKLVQRGYRDWSLHVYGLVGSALHLSLQDLRELPKCSHVIPVGSAFTLLGNGTWTGVPLLEVLKRCEVLPEAHYIAVSSYQSRQNALPYTEVLDRMLTAHAQAMLAYEVDGRPLSIEQGAPLRLQIEIPSGLKVVKYLRSLELIADNPRTDSRLHVHA